MTTTALMTELEALNLMLTAADEDPVQTATQPGHLPLSIAKGILNETSRVVQAKGWAFNTEDGYPLLRNQDGRIPLAPNTLSVDVDDSTGVQAIQRGLSLYDRKNHTSIFAQDLTGTVIVLLPWDELPQAVRYYLAICATRKLQIRLQAGDVAQYTQMDEQMALEGIQSFEADTADANFLTDSYSCASALLYRD